MNIKDVIKNFKEIDITENEDRGHGNGVSIKVVIPCYCQAKCEFCFNQLTAETQEHNYDKFFENLTKSLDFVVENVYGKRSLSLDITGNEPTFDIQVFKKFLNVIKNYKQYFNKIVLTSNGFHLRELIPFMWGIIDIVNISVHHHKEETRYNVFGTHLIPSDTILKAIVQELNDNGISSTAVTVLYKEYDTDFKRFFDEFTFWAKSIGFANVRMRSNFYAKDSFIDDIIYNIKIENESVNSLPGLTTKIINDKRNNFETRILQGVPDLTDYVVGVEMVIDDNGKLYVDYNKRYDVNKDNIDLFEKIYIK